MEAAAISLQVQSRPFAWLRRVGALQATVALTLLALGIRLVGITSRPLWLDESFSGWFAERSWNYLWTVVPSFEAHPPFYYSLLKLWLVVAPDSTAGLRSFSVLLGVAAVPVLIAAAREQERQDPSGRPLLRSVTVGFLAGCAPMTVALDQEARPYPLLILAYSVAMLGMLRLMREFSRGEAGGWRSWVLLSVGTELTLWAHALGILYAASLFAAFCPAWLGRGRSKDRLVRGLAAGVAVAFAYVPCVLLMTGRTHDWAMNWLAWRPSMLWQLATLYSVPIDVMTVGAAVGAIALLLLIKRAIELAFAAKEWNGEKALLVLWFGPPILSAVISALFVPIFLERTLAGTLAPAYLSIAGVLARVEPARERRLIIAALWLTLLPTAVQTALRPAMERWDDVAAYLHRNVAQDDEIWLYPTDSTLPLARTGEPIRGRFRAIPAPFPTLGIAGPIRAGWPAVVSVTRMQAEQIADDPGVRRVPVIWLVTRQAAIFDPDGDMPAALARVRRPGSARAWGYIEVRPYYVR